MERDTEKCKSGEKLYKGVRKRKWGKWVSEIRLPNSRERIWLGSYDSPEKAARAFDAALFCLRGRRANFNFPNTPCNVPLPVPSHHSLTPHQIQEVAAKFANEDPLLLKNPLAQESHADVDASAAAAAAAAGNSSSFGGKLCKSDSTAECSSSTVHECDGRVEVEHGDMDWTFLKEFDYSNDVFPVVGSDYDLYFDLHNMHSTSGELLYSTPPPPPFEGYQEFTEAEEDPFSHQSFLWNWNF